MTSRREAKRRDLGPAPLALTIGEPAGIGADITLLAWQQRRAADVPAFFLIGDADWLAARRDQIGLDATISVIGAPEEARDRFAEALPVLALEGRPAGRPGQPATSDAALVRHSIEQAVALARAGRASAVVTNPINKKALYEAGFEHAGHTEFLGRLCGVDQTVMLLASSVLKVVPLTVHIPLRDVAGHIDTGLIVETGAILAEALSRDFRCAKPTIAVAGLNPHAGEQGTLGREEVEIIRPAIDKLRKTGIDVLGPLAPDTMFHDEARRRYDAALCMYHDQALIALKTLDFHGGVNVTLNLPIVRTSPDHGTAFDIAGTGRADPRSLIAALRMAQAIADNRAAFDAAR